MLKGGGGRAAIVLATCHDLLWLNTRLGKSNKLCG